MTPDKGMTVFVQAIKIKVCSLIGTLVLASCSSAPLQSIQLSESLLQKNFAFSDYNFSKFCSEPSEEYKSYSAAELENEIDEIVATLDSNYVPSVSVDNEESNNEKLQKEIGKLCAVFAGAQSRWFKEDITSQTFANILNNWNESILNFNNGLCPQTFKLLFEEIDIELAEIIDVDNCNELALTFAAGLVGVNLDAHSLITRLRMDSGISFGINDPSLVGETFQDELKESLLKLINGQFLKFFEYSELRKLQDEFTGELFLNEVGDPKGPRGSGGVNFDFLVYKKDSQADHSLALYLSYVDSNSIGRIGDLQEVFVKHSDKVLKLEDEKELYKETIAGATGAIYFYNFEMPDEFDFFESKAQDSNLKFSLRGSKGRVNLELSSKDLESLNRMSQTLEFLSPKGIRLVDLAVAARS